MVAGGWAIDLFVGRLTREHADVDLVTWRDEQERLRHALSAWTFLVADGGALRPWRQSEWLTPPLHEIHASHASARLEFLLNDRDAGAWSYRRDPSIRRALSLIRHQRSGVPYLAPEVVLLYKSKAPRDDDERDLRAVAPALAPEARHWLQEAIAHSCPRHPWLDQLRSP